MSLKVLTGLSLLVMIVSLVGCAPNAVVSPAPFDQFDQQARTRSQQEYVIAPGDILDIKFLNYPELNELAMPVRPDGRISLQMVPEITAAGLTPAQLRDSLIQKYSSELKKPEITLILKSFSFQKVFVDGEVGSPGVVDLRGSTTVMNAITQAKGTKDTARLSNIIVIRKDFNGKPAGTNVDLTKVIDGTDFSQDITLMPYDIVYVPKSNIARVDLFVDQYINRVVPFGAMSPFLYYYSIVHD